MYYSLKDIKNNYNIPKDLLKIYESFTNEEKSVQVENENIIEEINQVYDNVNVVIDDNGTIEIALNDVVQEDVYFFEWKYNMYGHCIIMNNYSIYTKNISIKKRKALFDTCIIFNNNMNYCNSIENLDKGPIENSIGYFQYTYTGKSSIFITNGVQNNQNIYVRGHFNN